MKYHIETVIRRPLALLLVCLFIASTARAENAETARQQHKNSLVKGAWAMQFEIVGDLFNLNLRPFQGSTLSLKKHISDGSALRIGIGIGLTLSDQDATRQLDGDSENVSEYGTDNESIELIAQKIFYPSPNADVNFFYGIGPVAGFSHREYTTEQRSPMRKVTEGAFSWKVGASGVFGVEWFPTKSISVLAEYGSALQFEWQKITEKRLDDQSDDGTFRTVTEYKRKSLSIQSSSVKIGLSVYF